MRQIIPTIVKRLLIKAFGTGRYLGLEYFLYNNLVKDMGYDRAFFKATDTAKDRYYPLLAETMMAEFRPENLVNVGCGSGELCLAFVRAGCRNISAFDFSLAAVELARSRGIPSVQQIDLTRASVIPAKGDLCICLEVAEHIPERYAQHLCKLLSEVASNLVFTASPPDQGGHLHVNEKPQSYWIDLMGSFSIEYDSESVARIRQAFDGKMIPEYDRNLMVFRRRC